MAAKTSIHDTVRQPADLVSYPVAASVAKIWKGAPVFINASWYAYSNDGTTTTLTNGDMFVGWADETVTATAANGGVSVSVWATWSVIVPIAATAAQTDVGQNAYINDATDNAVVALASSTGNPQVTAWKILEIISSTRVRISTTGVYSVAANGA
jgi:hypothetical protein